MPLNRETGEPLEGLPGPYQVIDMDHVAGLRILATYEVPGKFRPRQAKRHIIDDAMSVAAESFFKAGALAPIALDESGTVIQAYPSLGKVAIVVMRPIAGQEHFVVRSYDLPPAAMRQLFANANIPFPELH